ncbi:MAG: 4-hydroxybenzoate octaprenyltransferase [Tropicimonas sp.]|uniref:4-hydroxybenzoate octaprenyltransferase n=1 Tax=Tropicimonas sp. TaxID=2067044 RepID=UPI003A88EEDF
MTQTTDTPDILHSDAAPAPGTVADAPSGNWVDRFAPLPARPYLRLSRADRPVGFWLLLIPCLWGLIAAAAASGWRALDLWLLIAAFCGAFLMRGAGCTWNDITDRDFDAAVERTRSRPLPSGQVSLRNALLWMGAQVAIAFAILLTFNATAIWLGIAVIFLVALYPFGKRFTWWPQVILGLNFNWGALLLWAAHEGALALAPVFLYFGGISWTLFYDTIYAHQDIEDDTLIGVKSTARLFGGQTPAWLRLFTMITVLMMSAGVVLTLAPSGSPLALALGLAGAWGMGLHMAWLTATVDLGDPQSCLTHFRAATRTGMIPAAGLVAALLVL